ncbi:MAG: excinuclease ABC subunit UvrB [Paludibacteraceae bacterium]|nr:excinuclease ABC subunit UvrB [Paludibacteraceae bacterium]MBQ8704746.1 excinuclease ABC subunit UvrB [Paludibacteraceae bacterium]
MVNFELCSPYKPTGDQPQAIESLVAGLNAGAEAQVLLGVTGSGKTFTIANVIKEVNRPTLIMSHNKTLAAQLYSEMKAFFPHNAVEYFVSYYDYYQPEAYIPSTDLYIEKDLSINEEIDRLRLSAVAALLSGRKDVIIVSSVSCIYGLGSPQDFTQNVIELHRGENIQMDKLLKQLVGAQYVRNDIELARGRFRVKGDTIDIALAYADYIVRIEFFGNEIDAIMTIDPVSGQVIEEFEHYNLSPATIFLTSAERIAAAKEQIQADLAKQIEYFTDLGEELYAKRIEERVKYDLEMLDELGYCSGVENYSRYFDGREEGTPPYCLLDYFPKDMLLVIDESHVTVPQIRGMYGGDKARKDNLVTYGFRLPAARDNRPLKFDEFEAKTGQTIYVSATPDEYELERSEGIVIDQLIRPTGLLDPEIEVRPTENQVDDLMDEIKTRIHRNERTLVTTLTKRMAEELDEYLRKYGIKSAYIHSDIDTIERVKIMEDLRRGEYDVLVGVNLLREGLDLPEVSLVAILDADKTGFLRDQRSLTQTVGRAARHVNGKAILYGDKITPAMQATINETNRRRTIQMRYNAEHGITPTAIKKEINTSALAGLYKDPEEEKRRVETAIRESWQTAEWQKMDAKTLEKAIDTKRKQMLAAAKATDFDIAARLRDEMIEMQNRLQAMQG